MICWLLGGGTSLGWTYCPDYISGHEQLTPNCMKSCLNGKRALMYPINRTGMCITFESVKYVCCFFFSLKKLSDSLYDFWTLHSPHVGGLVWLMGQVTWNLPDLSGARKAEGCAVDSAVVQAALPPGPMRTQRADQRHQLSGHNPHSEISLLSNRKYTRETSGCLGGHGSPFLEGLWGVSSLSQKEGRCCGRLS